VDIPVQYTLREPFFMSSRLMPAVRVGDATVHMRAHSIDVEDGDTVVRWEYLIDGPSVHYGANDVSSFYVGQAAIAKQLPTAMGGLLAALSHVGDGDEAGPFPHEVYQWAGRHLDEITVVLDGIDNPGAQEMPSSEVWRAITHDPYQTPYGRWCAAQAVAHADRLATLNPPAASTNTGLAVRDETWHDTALGWYTMLTNQPEPDHRTVPVCTVVDRDTIENWLRQSASGLTEGLGHDPGVLHTLVEQAQQAGLFGIRNHTIRAHTVVDHRTGSEATLLTIHTPSGATLAAGPIATDLLTSGVTGRGDEVTALRNCATAIASAYPASQGPVAPDRGRPFPPLGTDLASAATASPLPTGAAIAAHHHR
jgi:predicted secreted protein